MGIGDQRIFAWLENVADTMMRLRARDTRAYESAIHRALKYIAEGDPDRDVWDVSRGALARIFAELDATNLKPRPPWGTSRDEEVLVAFGIFDIIEAGPADNDFKRFNAARRQMRVGRKRNQRSSSVRQGSCSICAGRGVKKCPTCGGAGRWGGSGRSGFHNEFIQCHECDGRGVVACSH